MHKLAPRWPLVALTNYDFLQVGQAGASPWLGGVDADSYGGDFVKAAEAAVPGLTTLSPNYGFPQNGKVGDPGFRLYPDKKMLSEAHARGLKVVPWTCDDPRHPQDAHGPGRRRHHHQLPQPRPRHHGRAGHAASEGVPGPLTCRRRLCLLAGPAVGPGAALRADDPAGPNVTRRPVPRR